MNSPGRSFDEMRRALEGKYAGDALYRKVIADAELELQLTGYFFAAGTLIHTSEGFVPIEKIEVGDLVLAQPEDKGERTYKRVTRTMHFDQKPVIRVCYTPISAIAAAISEGRPRRDADSRSLIVTANHPFYIAGYSAGSFPPDEADSYVAGWQRADRLEHGALLELADGQQAVVERVDRIWRTRTEGVGWIELSRDSDDIGHLIDLRNGEILEHWGQYAMALP